MTATPTPEALDTATIEVIFALRDSLTDDSASRLEFWTGGRALTALQTAAAGAESAAEAVTIAARKLQIPQITTKATRAVTGAARVIDTDYQAWARHIDRTGVYILALADVERQTTRKKPTTTTTEKAPY